MTNTAMKESWVNHEYTQVTKAALVKSLNAAIVKLRSAAGRSTDPDVRGAMLEVETYEIVIKGAFEKAGAK